MTFSEIKAGNIQLQKELLLIALWTPDDEADHSPEVLELPHIKAYYENWGREGDIGFFAMSPDSTPMSIVQARYKSSQTKAYSDYPEVAIAIHPNYRGQGIASALMEQLIKSTPSGLRLGVHPKNTSAIKLYEKYGFRTYEVAESGYAQMVREI
ncbi:GNAT family N-acetyltransferase [Vibrio sp. SCSIO 43140]|uniref:GNAT family N-acetyltransferase n=1 Tax=Vibrio sp. SCSIO 43140 TaxID=2819100 RepID=UPI0020753987|nr:GNAT family N-acetyltransferase [Vibrio sp. SCSIO 43140]USD62075.1 GNAT family N-acetyltransferase [Vibrio sp. SCSIO 43140]